MHANVRADALRKDRLDDIKRGPGGIREIEFLVQTFQLLRGGREKALQTTSLFSAAASLKELELLPAETITELLSAYRFLRKIENRIQALHDQQSHLLPGEEDGLRVARAMGFEDMQSFRDTLALTRGRVQSLFEQSLPQPAAPDENKTPWQNYWQSARIGNIDTELRFANMKPLADFIKRLNRLSLSQRARVRLDQFMPILLERIADLSLDDAVVHRVMDLVSAICRRSAYLSLLVQNPQATERMLQLFSSSERVAQAVTRYPALLDELIDPSLGAHPPNHEDIQAGIDQILDSHGDTETSLQELNYLKQVISLRIAVAVLQSTMSVHETRSALSQLAQCLVQATLTLSKLDMETRHGHLPGPGLAVIAYGSLGAMNLGFDSDLDLIFLYQSNPVFSDGRRSISAERYHTGVARRMLSLLAATTPSGRLYSIDARLRPNGRSGLLVSSLDAFDRYQSEQAWTWELQALTRARPIAGNPETANGFEATRKRVLTISRDNAAIREDITSMRQRVETQHSDGNPLKHGRGGLIDIEFVTQLGILLNANHYPKVIDSTVIGEQLRALQICGWIDVPTFNAMDNAYVALNQARQQADLVEGAAMDDNIALLDSTRALCDEILR